MKTLSKSVLLMLAALFAMPITGRADGLPPVTPTTQPDVDDMPIIASAVGKPQETVGAGARGSCGAGNSTPGVYILASHTTGATFNTQPTIYWFLNKTTDVDIDFVIATDEDGPSAKSILKHRYTGDENPGLFAVSLADANVRLESGRQYRITVEPHVSADDSSADPYTRAYIAVGTRPAGLATEADVKAIGKAGFWYDAVDMLAKGLTGNQSATAQSRLCKLMRQERVFLTPQPPASATQTPASISAAEKTAVADEASQLKNFSDLIAANPICCKPVKW